MTSAPPPKPSLTTELMSVRRKSRTRRVVTIVAAAVAAVAVGGAVTAFAIRRAEEATARPARDALRGFYTDVITGNYGAAWQALCDSDRLRYGMSTLGETLERKRYSEIRILEVQVAGDMGTASVRFNFYGRSARTTTVEIIFEEGEWRPCRHPW